MTVDEHLIGWREAAVSGGLPQPRLERWQALRAGVVNLWEFEAVEYWYADGWAQLMGRNETGKSSLMALTTLIPWLADTSSDKIDTLGRSGKQFSYYVRPTGTEGDRRDANASLYHGWLWVEYGRLLDGEPHYFTTLLHALARSGNPRITPTWCTAEGSRVRDGLRLTQGREVLQPKDISAPGFEAHRTAGEYKTVLASRLLGAGVDDLEGIGKILKVTRTPKLGAQLDARFITERLREALPELQRTEVERLAEGWDQLDHIRDDLDRARDAATVVRTFATQTWRPWLGAVLRLSADEAVRRQTAFDDVTRRERQARTELENTSGRQTEIQQRLHDAQSRQRTARGEIEALRTSAEYRSAEDRVAQAKQAARDAVLAAERRDRSADEAHNARRRVDEVHRDAEIAAREAEAAEEAHRKRTDDLGAQARNAGIEVPEPLDPDLLHQRGRERDALILRLEKLLREHAAAQQKAERLDDAAGVHAAAAAKSSAAAEEAWADAESERDRLASELRRWAAAAPEPVGMVEDWLNALPTTGGAAGSSRLADLVRGQWYEPHHHRLSEEHRRAHAARKEAEARGEELRQEIERLLNVGVQPPEVPQLWHRRSRADVTGAPLWRLLNPVDQASPADLAHVEAALAAAGLLDAWVSPDGIQDALDTFVAVPDPVSGATLGRVLRVAPEAGELARMAQAVLDGVGLRSAEEELPGAGLAVSRDGRWRSSALTGRAAPLHEAPEWLGEAAREAARQRRLDALRQQAEEWGRIAASHGAEEEQLRIALERLAEAFRNSPTDDGLRKLLVQAAERSQRAESDSVTADKALHNAQLAGAEADRKYAGMTQFARESDLPADHEDLREVRDALKATITALTLWRGTAAQASDTRRRAERYAAALTERRREHETAVQRSTDDEQSAHVAEAKAKASREAIDAEDGAILDRLRGLEDEEQRALNEGESLSKDLTAVALRHGSAVTALEQVEEERRKATEQRNSAYASLRRLIDRGVAVDLGLDLSEPDSSAVEHVRAQSREIRRAIQPRSWSQDDAGANQSQVQRLYRLLGDRARDVRSELEQGGRSLQVRPDEVVDVVEITVDSWGRQLPIAEAVQDLAGKVDALEGHYDEEVRKTLDELLGSTFLEHMRNQIAEATNLIGEINRVLAEHSTGETKATLRIKLAANTHKHVLDALAGSTIINPDVQEQVREFLKDRVDEARRTAADEGLTDWHDSLAHHLDYRTWYTVALERRFDAGSWGPLTPRSYAELSGGARAVMLMLPLVAALAALYRRMPQAPRPLWLDEAFDGLDTANRAMVMRLLRQFELDVLLAGPGRLVNVEAVPAAAIYQVVRAPAPHPGADLTLELWAGNTLEAIELPLSWLDEPPEAPEAQDSLL